MPSFYFEQLLQTGLNGIDQQGITAAVLQVAGVILIFSLLWSVYEAYSNGGDVRLLGVAAVKYLVLGLVFLNYQNVFRAVNSMFNGVADGIYNLTGAGDVVQAWLNAASSQWSGNQDWFSAIWNLVTGGAAAIVSAIITLIGFLLLPVTYAFFTLFYAMYGSILYVVGPFVLAFIPSRGLGQLGRTFFINLIVFQCWGVLYAILQALMSALQINSAQAFINNTSFLNSFKGASSMILMSIASVLLSIMIALIPFIASRIVRGDVGSTLMTVVSGAVTAGAVASGLAFAGGQGLAGGRLLAPDGPPPPPTAGFGGASNPGVQGSAVAQGQSVSNGGSAIAQSRPPVPPGAEAGNGAVSSTSSPTLAVDSSPSTGGGEPSALRNAKTGQVFSWNGSGWQDAGHVGTTGGSSARGSGGSSDSTHWTGSNTGRAARGYAGRSLAGLAAWQAGHMIGSTMRLVGMGKAQ